MDTHDSDALSPAYRFDTETGLPSLAALHPEIAARLVAGAIAQIAADGIDGSATMLAGVDENRDEIWATFGRSREFPLAVEVRLCAGHPSETASRAVPGGGAVDGALACFGRNRGGVGGCGIRLMAAAEYALRLALRE